MPDKRPYRVLVPLDGSTLAEEALPVARRLVGESGDDLILLRVAVPSEMPMPVMAEYGMVWSGYGEEATTPEEEHQQAVDYLEGVQGRKALAALNVRVLVLEGDRSQLIVETADNQDVDLIVMTSHGRTGLSRWVIGSVAERVLESGPCPVLLLRDSHADAAIPQRILVTLDGSPLSETALDSALALAQRLGASVTLLRVWPHGSAEALADTTDPYLDDVMTRYAEWDVPLTAASVEAAGSGAANTALAILDFANGEAVDLIAMSTHGRSGLQRWVYGSVTEKVLRGTEKALLVVRPGHTV